MQAAIPPVARIENLRGFHFPSAPVTSVDRQLPLPAPLPDTTAGVIAFREIAPLFALAIPLSVFCARGFRRCGEK